MKKQKTYNNNQSQLMTFIASYHPGSSHWNNAWSQQMNTEQVYRSRTCHNTANARHEYLEYPIVYAANQSPNAFKFLHSKLQLADDKPLLTMLQENSLSEEGGKNKPFFDALTSNPDYRKHLKAAYLNLIQNSSEHKSLLKMDWMLGIENHFITFLRTSKKHALNMDTKHYKLLAETLKAHPLNDDDLAKLREKLLENIDDDAFAPKPAFAAVYFAHQAPDNADDYKILQKHLMISKRDYTAGAKKSIERLVKTAFSDVELKNLKKHLSDAIKSDEALIAHGKETLKAGVDSPLTTIICTQIRQRGDDNGKTYRALRTVGLFGSAKNAKQASAPTTVPPTAAYQEGGLYKSPQ
jgi:hypothetical protein